MKTCSKCEIPQSPEEFHKRGASKDGLNAQCKTCVSTNDRSRSTYKRSYFLLRTYGLTEEQFNGLLEKQGGVCALCKGAGDSVRPGFCVDHDHTSGKIRALLCHSCNLAIGFLAESAKRALEAAEYLTKHGKP